LLSIKNELYISIKIKISMKKLIFRKFIIDVLIFFAASITIMGLIVWTLQAVNYFDFVTEDLDNTVNEKLIYSLLNIIDQDNKFIIVTSEQPIVNIDFSLKDLKSRTKNFLLQKIEKPDDDLMFALILKNLSDRQILLDKKIIDFIIKRIDRSYGKIYDFIYKIDELSLKKKKIRYECFTWCWPRKCKRIISCNY
ncbi:DnaA/Hda family protein, partial [bacterium]|nr:DnaA/Hda family protein [bacterium]